MSMKPQGDAKIGDVNVQDMKPTEASGRGQLESARTALAAGKTIPGVGVDPASAAADAVLTKGGLAFVSDIAGSNPAKQTNSWGHEASYADKKAALKASRKPQKNK